MNGYSKSIICSLCLLAFSMGDVFAQSLQDIAGAWKLFSARSIHEGKKIDMYGPNPRGMMSIEANGRYMMMVARANLPKVAAGDRTRATAEENNAIVDGSIAHFGTISVDAAAHTLDLHIEASTYPNWDGADQKRRFTVDGDELRYSNASGSTGTGTDLVWKRIR